jgi:hypothetical protein
MRDTPLGLISTDNLFRLAALYGADVNDAKRSGDEEAAKRLSAKEAEIIAELERRDQRQDSALRWMKRPHAATSIGYGVASGRLKSPPPATQSGRSLRR